jgi:hypothetical protein
MPLAVKPLTPTLPAQKPAQKKAASSRFNGGEINFEL